MPLVEPMLISPKYHVNLPVVFLELSLNIKIGLDKSVFNFEIITVQDSAAT